MRIRAVLASAVLATTLATGIAVPATAAPLSPQGTVTAGNVLRGFCANIDPRHHRRTNCVADANDDARTLAFRDERGTLRRYTYARAALAFLRHHSKPCAQEDSPSCFWDAHTRGNGIGESYLAIGRGGVYLADVTTRP